MRKYSPNKIKSLIRARLENARQGTRVQHHWVLNEDQDNPPRYCAAGCLGDLIVVLVGDSPGEIGWEENLGSVL